MPNDIFHTAKQLEELRKLGLLSDMRTEDQGGSYFVSPDQPDELKQNYDEVLNQTILKKPYNPSLPLAIGQGSAQGARIGDQGGIIPSNESVGLYDSPDRKPASAPVKQAALTASAPKAAPAPTEPMQGSVLDFGQSGLANQQGLLDAQKRQNELQFLANMNRSFAQVAQGLAQSKPLDTSVADAVERQGKQAVADYIQQVDFQKQDPGSAYSKGIKDYFKSKLGIEIRGDASAADLEKIMPFAVREYEAKEERKRLEMQAKESREARKEERAEDRRSREAQSAAERASRERIASLVAAAKGETAQAKKKQQGVTNIGKVQTDFNKDKDVVKANAGLAAAEDAEELLDVNNPITSEAVKTSLARLSGEVGVLTDQDVSRFGGSKAVSSRIQQSLQQMYDGKLTAQNRQFMKEIITAFKNARNRQIDKSRQKYADQAAKRLDIPYEEALEYLRPTLYDPGVEAPGQGSAQDPKIKEYADAHFQGDYEKAKALLEKRGYKSGQ